MLSVVCTYVLSVVYCTQVIADDGKAVLLDVAKRIQSNTHHKTLLSTMYAHVVKI